MKHEIRAESSAQFLKDLRRELRADLSEVARRTWHDRALLSRIELGREPKLPTLRRLVAALGGRLEIAARFERTLEALAEDFVDERLRRRALRERAQHERNLARWARRARLRGAGAV